MTKAGAPLDDRAYVDICLPGPISDEHIHNVKGNDERQVFLGNHPKLARVRAREAYEEALGGTSACVYAWHWDHRPHRIKLGKTTKGLGRWTDVPTRHTDIDPDEWAEMMGERERVHLGFVDLPVEHYGVAESRLLAAFDCLPGSEWVEASASSVLAVQSLIAEVYDGTLHTPTPDATPWY
ncbi:MAG: hypothetical protein RIB65_14865 [Ilumatobacter fluminis]|uniref:hypothetical protein n=1 Tax=Ilumatobacter fluminis TaxID=467091 RepID=UPI0032ED93D1